MEAGRWTHPDEGHVSVHRSSWQHCDLNRSDDAQYSSARRPHGDRTHPLRARVQGGSRARRGRPIVRVLLAPPSRLARRARARWRDPNNRPSGAPSRRGRAPRRARRAPRALRALAVRLRQPVQRQGEGGGQRPPRMVPRRVLRGVRPGDARGWKDSTGTGAQGDGAGVQGGVRGGAAQGGVHHPRCMGETRRLSRHRRPRRLLFPLPGPGRALRRRLRASRGVPPGPALPVQRHQRRRFRRGSTPVHRHPPDRHHRVAPREFFADTWPGKALGLSSPRASRDEDEDDRDAKKK